jgi:hypothetical protein
LFGADIQAHLASLHRALDHAASGLKLERPDLSELEAAYRDIQHALPVLMLLPDGGYQERVASMIESMEEQDGRGALYATDRAFLAQLRQHQSALARLSRNSPEDWQRVGHLLSGLDDSVETAYDDGESHRPN